MTQINDDNLFPEGTLVKAKVNPGLSLKIEKYINRIYYCSVVGQPDTKQSAYFERELIGPQNPNS